MVAANPMRGEALLGEGADAYKLVLDVNAWCAIQPSLGMKPMEVVGSFENHPDDILVTRALLWGALQKHHACHLIEAGEIMADAGFLPTRAALAECLAAAFGASDAEDKEETDPRKPRRKSGTG